MVELTKTAGIPVYVQIRETLRGEITQEILKPGEKLPSEHELASRFGVSRMTVRQSIAELIDEGLLYRRHGVGTFVTLPHLERDHTRLTNSFDPAESEGNHTVPSLLSLEIIPAGPKVAKALYIKEADLVIRIRILGCANNVPITVHDAHVPHKLFSHVIDKNLEVQDLWSLFEHCGYKVKRAIEHIEAREATKELAKLMKVKAGVPLLYKERTIYAKDGTPVEFTYCYNRGDIYSLTVSLER
jgi:GntR family transcriptional regulator